MEKKRESFLHKQRYLFAVASVTAVAVIRHLLNPMLGQGTPLIFFMFAVTLTALVGGLGPGLLATALSAAVGSYFFMEPVYSFRIDRAVDRVVMAGFLFESVLISFLIGRLLNTKKSAESSLSHLRESIVREEQTSQSLAASEETFRTIFDNVSVGMGLVDPRSGKFVNVNAKFCQITGYPLDELKKMTPFELTHPDDRESDRIKYGDYMKGKTPNYFRDKRYVRKDGRVIWVRVFANQIQTSSKLPARSIGIVQDITAEKSAETEILKAKEAAERATEAKSRFLANMSHEIRTPLGAIMGFSELIADPLVKPQERASYVGAIKRNGELLSNIINDILDLSKVEAEKIEVCWRDISLAEILSDTRALVEPHVREKCIALSIQVERDVPAVIRTDPLRLKQILINIIGNAVKFTARGLVEVNVRHQIVEGGHPALSFIVRDTGSGIPGDQVAKLFAPFSQADSTAKRRFGGTGLGLILSKRLASLLGGDVVLTRTEAGIGSTFTITIDPGPPQGRAQETQADTYSVDLSESGPPRRLDGIRILLVEDAPDNQVLISRMLKLAGARIDIASNGSEAIDKAKSGQYDVVLMDIQMPVMDGYEATAELRRGGYSGKIVALTAHALSEEKRKCLDGGFDAHLSKPIDRGALIQKIDAFCRASH